MRKLETRQIWGDRAKVYYGWELSHLPREERAVSGPVHWQYRDPRIGAQAAEMLCVGPGCPPDVTITVYGDPADSLLTHYWSEDPQGKAAALAAARAE
jgi:hypothetical protein